MEPQDTQQQEPSTTSKVLARIDYIAAFFISLVISAAIIQLIYDEFSIALILPGLAYVVILMIAVRPAVKIWHWTVGLMLAIFIGILQALVRPRR